jgi:phosphopantetheinyl transferase (holo-ACP synthase)
VIKIVYTDRVLGKEEETFLERFLWEEERKCIENKRLSPYLNPAERDQIGSCK